VIKYAGEDYCGSYAEPADQWSLGVCNFATHRRMAVQTGEVTSSNPLKASKRAAHKK